MDSTDEPPQSSQNQISSPLPQVGIPEILGLLEVVKTKGGHEDIYKLASELKMEFGDTLAVIRGAELLGLVHTPGGDVSLEPLGEKVTKARIKNRKEIIKERLSHLAIFKNIVDLLHQQDEKQMERDELIEKLAELIPNESAEATFATIVSWGRYAELFGYNDDTRTFYLDQGQDVTEA